MKSTSRWVGLLGLGLAVGMVWMVARAGAGEPPAPPKVSSFAPAKDVASEVQKYIKRLEDAVANEADYKDAETTVPKDANTLILLALAAGLHDEDNAYKAAAPAMIKAAQAVAAAKDYASAKAAVDELKKAAESKGDASNLKWAKIASLPAVDEGRAARQQPAEAECPARSLQGKTADNGGDSATLAVIAQGSIADTLRGQDPRAGEAMGRVLQ